MFAWDLFETTVVQTPMQGSYAFLPVFPDAVNDLCALRKVIFFLLLQRLPHRVDITIATTMMIMAGTAESSLLAERRAPGKAREGQRPQRMGKVVRTSHMMTWQRDLQPSISIDRCDIMMQ